MKSIRISTIVKAPPEFSLVVSNDLVRWPSIMTEYKAVRILEAEGKKIWFELDHENGTSWRSWRRIDLDNLFAYAERFQPLHPFKFMQILWAYKPVEGGCEMIWDMCFEPANIENEENMLISLQSHSEVNINKMRDHIESEYKFNIK